MRTSIKVRPYCFPQPVIMIATYNEDQSCNVMNAAWGMSVDMNKMAICISQSHKTCANILREKACSIAFATSEYVKEADYFGIVSGNQIADKLKHTKLTHSPCETVNAPMINEFKMALECSLESYDFQSEIMILEIKNVSVDDSILNDHSIDILKLDPICYDASNHQYLKLGEVVGKAFSDGKKLI